MVWGTMIALAALAPAGQGTCFAAARAIPQGTVLTAGDVTPVACKAATRPPLRYDATSGNPVATAAIPARSYLGRLAPVGNAVIPAGTELTLRSSSGVVTIERRVTALQPGHAGGRVFVRASSGEVFAVPLVLEAQ